MTRPVKAIFAWLGLLGAIFLVLWVMVKRDLESLEIAQSDYIRKSSLLQRLEALPEREAVIKRRLADLGNDAVESKLYQGSRNQVLLDVQRDVRRIADEVGVQINAIRPLRTQDDLTSRLSSTTVQLNFVANYDTLLKFLASTEANSKLLRSQKFSVRVQRSSTVSEDASLAAVVEVSGYSRSFSGTPS